MDLKVVAEKRHTDPMNTWPEHITGHRINIERARLFDYDCLRCHLEEAAYKAAMQERKEP